MTNHKETFSTFIMHWAERRFRDSSKEFALNPNSHSWNDMMRVMFIYQQAEYASRSPAVNLERLMGQLSEVPFKDWDSKWGDLICLETVNLTVNDALRDTPTYTA
jgi:hypothetical protein